MKKQIWMSSMVAAITLFAVSGVIAQGGKKMDQATMDMAEMKKSPHHLLMMAHHHSALAFARVLRGMTKDGKFADVEIARNAFAEIKHCMGKMEEIHQSRMASMSAEMRVKMEPMMAKMKPKMDADKAVMKEHMDALEKALQMDAPDAVAVQKHATELVLHLEKMDKPDKKMEMAGKKPM